MLKQIAPTVNNFIKMLIKWRVMLLREPFSCTNFDIRLPTFFPGAYL